MRLRPRPGLRPASGKISTDKIWRRVMRRNNAINELRRRQAGKTALRRRRIRSGDRQQLALGEAAQTPRQSRRTLHSIHRCAIHKNVRSSGFIRWGRGHAGGGRNGCGRQRRTRAPPRRAERIAFVIERLQGLAKARGKRRILLRCVDDDIKQTAQRLQARPATHDDAARANTSSARRQRTARASRYFAV